LGNGLIIGFASVGCFVAAVVAGCIVWTRRGRGEASGSTAFSDSDAQNVEGEWYEPVAPQADDPCGAAQVARLHGSELDEAVRIEAGSDVLGDLDSTIKEFASDGVFEAEHQHRERKRALNMSLLEAGERVGWIGEDWERFVPAGWTWSPNLHYFVRAEEGTKPNEFSVPERAFRGAPLPVIATAGVAYTSFVPCDDIVRGEMAFEVRIEPRRPEFSLTSRHGVVMPGMKRFPFGIVFCASGSTEVPTTWLVISFEGGDVYVREIKVSRLRTPARDGDGV
jgi:hypothetical protein